MLPSAAIQTHHTFRTADQGIVARGLATMVVVVNTLPSLRAT